MEYSQVLEWLSNQGQFRLEPSLEGIGRVLAELGEPHLRCRVVLVGGTNGKGVCAHHLAHLLQAHGARVGLYTSPHLNSLRERMSIDGRLVAEADLADAVSQVLAAGERCDEVPTYFEALTASAYWWFASHEVDWAVMEVGMGGTWDATNIAQAQAAIITTVSKDHTAYLGATRREIASTKADILPAKGLGVTGAKGEALEIIRTKAATASTKLLVVEEDFHLSGQQTLLRQGWPLGQRFNLETPEHRYNRLQVPLPGPHQGLLASLAVVTAEALLKEDFKPEVVAEALVQPSPPGRWEVVRGDPPLVLDGAHNHQALAALANLLKTIPAPVVAVVGQMEDKPGSALLPLIGAVGHFIATSVGGPRALSPAQVAERLRPLGVSFSTAATVEEGLEQARDLARPRRGVVCVTGSFYLVGKAREVLGLATPDQ